MRKKAKKRATPKGKAPSKMKAPPKKKKKAPKSGATKQKAHAVPTAAIAPLFVVPPSEGSTQWTLCLADGDSPIDLFEEEGHSGNGYAWDSVARVVMEDRAIAADAVRFDSEAGTFVALASSRDVLLALGEALVAVLRDEAALRDAIRRVPSDDWDD